MKSGGESHSLTGKKNFKKYKWGGSFVPREGDCGGKKDYFINAKVRTASRWKTPPPSNCRKGKVIVRVGEEREPQQTGRDRKRSMGEETDKRDNRIGNCGFGSGTLLRGKSGS